MTKCKLGGVPLSAAAAIPWALTEGVAPFQSVFEVHVSRAESILSQSGPLTLHVERDNGTSEDFEGVWVMGSFPTDKTYTVGIMCADSRWSWNRTPVVGAYNVRRKTGEIRLLGDKLDVASVLDPVIGYEPRSLKDGKRPWTPLEMLEDVFQQVTGTRYDLSGAISSRTLPVDGLEFEGDPGDQSIERALAFLPGHAVWLRKDMVAAVKNAVDVDATEAELPPIESGIVGGPLHARVTFERTRPSQVILLFDRECELRTDFRDEETAGGTTAGYDRRDIHNVLPCPDVTLAIPADPTGQGRWEARDVHQGTWITFDEFFAAVAALGERPTFFGEELPPFTSTILRKLWFSSDALQVYAASSGTVDPVWDRRLQACLTHYRQTFRLDPKWRAKIRSFKAYRVGVLDPKKGTRAPSPVFADYCVMPSSKRLELTAGDGNKAGWNVFALNDDGAGDLAAADLANARKCTRAIVVPLDQSQGIFRVEYQGSPSLTDARVFPSAVESVPLGDPSQPTELLLWEDANLKASHRLATILTVIQAAPNDLRRYHQVTVKPEDVAPLLGRDVGPCRGPVWYLRINATARFAWVDANGYPQDLEEVFGVVNPNRQAQKNGAAKELSTLVNADEVSSQALAAAAGLYQQLMDRREGSITVPFDPSKRPVGSISSVEHTVTPEGLPITTMTLPPNLAAIDVAAYLPEGILRRLRGLVQAPE